MEKSQFIPEGESVNVNGQAFDGPVNVILRGELIETSAVVIGADRNGTATDIAAIFGVGNSPENSDVKGKKMDPKFVDWVMAEYGLDAEKLEAAAAEKLEAKLAENDPEPLLTLYGLGATVGAGIYALLGEIAGAAGYGAPASFLLVVPREKLMKCASSPASMSLFAAT